MGGSATPGWLGQRVRVRAVVEYPDGRLAVLGGDNVRAEVVLPLPGALGDVELAQAMAARVLPLHPQYVTLRMTVPAGGDASVWVGEPAIHARRQAPPAGSQNSYDRGALTPELGSLWVWEISRPAATALIEVTEVRWNGEQWWVRTRLLLGSGSGQAGGDETFVNDLGRFTEAVIPVGAALRSTWLRRVVNGRSPQSWEL